MSRAAVRTPRYAVVFDGQSLNLFPGVLNSGYPITLMNNYFPTVPWHIAAIGAMSWTKLSVTAAKRSYVHANDGLTTVLIMLGGTNDLSAELDSGAKLYADEVAYANGAKSAGFDYVINTPTTPSLTFGTQTCVAALSNGVDVASFSAGSGTLNAYDTTGLNGQPAFASSGTLKVRTLTGTATITYTNKTSTTFGGCTTTAGSGFLSTGLLVGNSTGDVNNLIDSIALVVGNADGAFDYIADFSVESRLTDASNTTYFADGLHWNATGAAVGASLVAAKLSNIIP